MNSTNSNLHPTSEDWAGYLYGELAPEARARIDRHLGSCADCQRQMEGSRETMAALDTWKLPRRSRPSSVITASARWAIAAALALGLGWLGGRMSAPALPDAAALHAELLPGLRQEVQQTFQAQLAAAIQASDQRNNDRMVDLAQAWAQAREEDQQTTLALYERAGRQQRLESASFRRDLETVAVVAQNAIGNTQEQLTQLAANTLTRPVGDGGLPR